MKEQAHPARTLSAGLAALPGVATAWASTQAAWRFFNNRGGVALAKDGGPSSGATGFASADPTKSTGKASGTRRYVRNVRRCHPPNIVRPCHPADRPTEAIKKLAFFDAEGREVESQVLGQSSSGFGDRMTYGTLYGLARKLDRVTVRITYYETLEPVTVPLDLTTGVGF